MKKTNLEIYNPEKTYVFPNMAVATPERIQMEYSAINLVKCVITTDASSTMFFALEPLYAMCQRLGVETEGKTDEEVLVELEDILNKEPEQEVSAEERIAAALEYQNLLLM